MPRFIPARPARCATAPSGVLSALEREALLAFQVVDVDTDPLLRERFGERVPVVALSTGDCFEGRISEFRIRRALERGA